MNFLQTLVTWTPIALKPDRPASSYKLSYDQIYLSRSEQQLNIQKNRMIKQEMNRLISDKRDMQIGLEENKNKFLQRNLMLQLEIERLHRIICEWDIERRKYSDEIKLKQRLYQTRLEQIKKLLKEQFEAKLCQIKQETKSDLQRLRENFDYKLLKYRQQASEQNQRIKQLQLQVDRLQNKLQLMEGDRKNLQATISIKESKISQLEQDKFKLSGAVKLLQRQKQTLQDQKQADILHYNKMLEQIDEDYNNSKRQNQQLQDSIQSLQNNFERRQDDIRRAQKKIIELQGENDNLRQQINSFRSRKTQPNVNNNISNNQSQRQQLSPVMKDSQTRRNLGSLEEQRQEIQDLKAQIKQLEAQIFRLQGREDFHEQQLKQLRERLQITKSQFEQRQSQYIEKIDQKQKQITKLTNLLDMIRQENSKKQRSWLQKLSILQENCDRLTRQWRRKENQYNDIFKKIESEYKQKIRDILHEKDQILLALTEKTKQLAQHRKK